MAEKYQEFLQFDWSDERWRNYFDSLYPTPSSGQILKFKKKWYKRVIDSGFDDTCQPSVESFSSNKEPKAPTSATFRAAYGDDDRWAVMSRKAIICFCAYAMALIMAAGAMAHSFPPLHALMVLVSAFVLEILAKYGFKFKKEYLQSVLLDDVGIMPIMSFTLLMPGLHPDLRMLALIPSVLTALLSISSICKGSASLPKFVRDFFSPLAQVSARHQVMQARSHIEVLLGVVLIVGVFIFYAAPISVILYWNFMMMRYMTNSWTQGTFQKIDRTLEPIFGGIPGVRNLYIIAKSKLYGFVDPEAKRGGMCTIL